MQLLAGLTIDGVPPQERVEFAQLQTFLGVLRILGGGIRTMSGFGAFQRDNLSHAFLLGHSYHPSEFILFYLRYFSEETFIMQYMSMV
jgi:hypothetical protein